MKVKIKCVQLLILFVFNCIASLAQPVKQWVTFHGFEGPGKGKNIVFVSGDEEYRSEEALPMLAQILAKRFGFSCTVLFSTDPKTGEIDPMYLSNIYGLEHLENADLMVILTRFRELPDSQMKYIDEYIKAGKPIVGLRTATHAFNYKLNKNSPYAKYDFKSTINGWEDGFGRQILGETWVSHHGYHLHEGTRGVVIILPKFETRELVNNFRNLTISNEKANTQKIRSSLQSQSCS